MGNYTYFDLLAQFGIGGAHPGGFLLTQELLSAEQINNQSKILDVGCGTGQTSAYLYNKFKADITGLDINPIMLEKAKNRFLTQKLPIELIQGSVEKIPVKDSTFDFVLSESVLAFVGKENALKEISRILKKGGRLIANEMTINSTPGKQEALEIKEFYGLDTLFLEDDWRSLLEEVGFTDIVIKSGIKPLIGDQQVPEFNFSSNFEPELFGVLNKHAEIIIKYEEFLSYRIITCTKN
ncbi:class I SAM-dependent methyltransferase [Neobacillus sp. PS3-12]|jgi:SAM-dependent methyltransferase|uniref:class I SAM-dependent methyltransferase n=1 Tax=Neobacillus sp. PS3-12 TaxID=3070677 RepID=UPI0027DF0E17|nr:class I SAM-dependent methyltransferase [Neobacillus sp. PS3-12]WML52948.1 class I SAM-dependent methyltransferase [Neobacillus sp. PS3-12]